jgi:hypothetical protein
MIMIMVMIIVVMLVGGALLNFALDDARVSNTLATH